MLTPPTLAALHAKYPQLLGLDAALASEFAGTATLLDVPAGTTLFHAGSPCEAFPLVLQGSVRVAHSSAEGREITLYRVQPGELCVMSSGSMLGGQPYAASGETELPTRLLVLPRALFAKLMEGSPSFREQVFGVFSARLLDLMRVVDAVAFHKLDERLATLLLQRGPSLHVTHQQLAAELGSVREFVTRVLNDFQSRKLLRLGREHIEVLDEPGLRRVAGLAAPARG